MKLTKVFAHLLQFTFNIIYFSEYKNSLSLSSFILVIEWFIRLRWDEKSNIQCCFRTILTTNPIDSFSWNWMCVSSTEYSILVRNRMKYNLIIDLSLDLISIYMFRIIYNITLFTTLLLRWFNSKWQFFWASLAHFSISSNWFYSFKLEINCHCLIKFWLFDFCLSNQGIWNLYYISCHSC